VSSLLDILHRRDSRADEPDVTTPVDDAPATIELHLAVDNGPGAPAAGPVDEPAAGPDIALAPEPVFPAGPEAPPIDPPPASWPASRRAARVAPPGCWRQASRSSSPVPP